MTTVVVKFLDGIVGHQVAVVEEQTVQTQACGELEVVGSIPLLLSVDAQLAEAYACGGSSFAIITIGQTYHFGCSTVDEVVHATIAIVTGTITHILVVRHLVLIADTCYDLVVASVVCDVVLDVEDGIVYGIVPCEEFVTQSHVLSGSVGTIVDVYEGELVGVGTTYIVKL